MKSTKPREIAERIEEELGLSSPELLIDVPDPRRRTQLQCAEYLRREESQRQRRHVTENEALMLWHRKHYDERFAEMYEKGCDPKRIYKAIVHPED